MATTTLISHDHPVRTILQELERAAQRYCCHDAGRIFLDAAIDPLLDRESLETYLERAETRLRDRIDECYGVIEIRTAAYAPIDEYYDVIKIRDAARSLLEFVHDLLGLTARTHYEDILHDLRARFGENAL